MKTFIQAIAICVFATVAHMASAQDKHLIDSLEQLIKPGTSDSMRLEIELSIAHEYLFSDAERCLEHAQRALVLAYQLDEKWVIPYLHDYTGMCYDDLGRYDEALIAYTQAIEITEDLMVDDTVFYAEYQRDLAVFLNNVGYTEFNRGNSAKALEYYIRALDLARAYDSEEICEVYASIAELYLEKNDFANAHQYASLAAEAAPDSAWIWYDAALKGAIFLAAGKPDSALALYNEAVNSDLTDISSYDLTIVYNGTAEALIGTGDYERGLEMADSALNYARKLGNRIHEAEAYSLRSMALSELGDHVAAMAQLREGIKIARESGSILHLADYLAEQARQESIIGNYNEAYSAQLASSRLADSIRSGLSAAEITEVLMGHEAIRTAEETSQLQEQLEIGIIRERNTRRFALVMFICALLLAVTTYLVIQRRQAIKFSLSPITTHPEGDDRIVFMRRMTISVAVLLIPLVIYNAIWQEFERGIWAFSMLVFVTAAHILVRNFQVNIAPALILLSYPLIVFAPGATANLITVLWIPAAFMILSYASDSLKMQIANGLLAASALIAFLYRFNMTDRTGISDVRPEAHIIIGVMALGAMFFALYYHRGRMFDYRFGLDRTSTFLRLMADANPNFVFAKDRDRRYTFANKAMSDAYGLPLSSIIGRRPEEINPAFTEQEHFKADDMEVLEEGVDKLIPEEKVYNTDGSDKWLRTLKKPIRNTGGEVVGLMGIATDITAMRESQRELKESLSLLQATIDSTADGLLVVDDEMRIVLMNQKFIDIWGESVVTIDEDGNRRLGKAAEKLKDPEAFISQVKEIMSSPHVVTEDRLEFKDGRIIERYSQPQQVGERVVGRVWSFRDVTSREDAIRDLVRSEDRYRTSLEDNLFSIVRVRDGHFLSANKAFSDLTGYTNEEIVRFTLSDVVHKEDLEKFAGFAREVISGNQPTGSLECRIVRKDGSLRYILASIKGYYGDDGTYFESTVTAADITQLKQVESALAESEARYRSLVEASPDGILLTNMDGVITYASRRFLELTGLPIEGEDSPIGRNLLEFAEPEEYERAEKDLAGALASSGPAFARYWVRIAGGDRLRVELGTRLIRDKDEEPSGVIVVVRDITEKAKAEDVLRASESRYRVLFENTFDGFLILEKDGRIEDVNQSAVDLLDYPDVDALRSKNISQLFPDLLFDASFEALVSGEVHRTLPIRTEGTDFFGNEIYAEVNLSLVPMQSGQKIACAIKDIAERVVLENKERELESQEAQLDALNRQLASLSIFNSQKMKLLSEIQADLDEARRNASNQVQSVLQRVGRKIESNLNEQEDMMAFKIQFEKIHPNFFKKLTELCPKLTSHDLKYCAYMRLNMTTQDIANLLYVEKKSVEMSKYRIKKKLGLGKGERLSEFLHTI